MADNAINGSGRAMTKLLDAEKFALYRDGKLYHIKVNQERGSRRFSSLDEALKDVSALLQTGEK